MSIPWIRVHYAYPTGLTEDIINAFREVPNVLPYLDLPLQHSHPDVLKAINRPWQTNLNNQLLDRIRKKLPEAVFRTSLIVGFPGETKEQFEHLVSFVEAQEFDHIGVFTFSSEEDTQAAQLPQQIPADIAQARKDKIISIQQPIAAKKNQKFVGRIVDVLIEKEDDETGDFIGRCYRFAPEIDGFVRLKDNNSNQIIKPGMMVPALITGSHLYDLTAKIVGASDLVSSLKSN